MYLKSPSALQDNGQGPLSGYCKDIQPSRDYYSITDHGRGTMTNQRTIQMITTKSRYYLSCISQD
ncbi:hypothetical protein P175DRAFT_0498664 [Aspergillus ochraceoroseus IBT 24754]|uniref:Uncharacterized protein n=1 Tax=Aspergillus ochraceoroseus IBT 24754 TaxID=1392256 RepID=A0A2T5MAL7_9EURO|nr:uncharacterized protein P175DRAFT_0498664 [Aspergillus ochraceoroseus IBT 24754]PTU25560.1 hypothetical protein P175DRAFT_0498664 [Aspergillus ochraceoroseus IBT 24754]